MNSRFHNTRCNLATKHLFHRINKISSLKMFTFLQCRYNFDSIITTIPTNIKCSCLERVVSVYLTRKKSLLVMKFPQTTSSNIRYAPWPPLELFSSSYRLYSLPITISTCRLQGQLCEHEYCYFYKFPHSKFVCLTNKMWAIYIFLKPFSKILTMFFSIAFISLFKDVGLAQPTALVS